MLAKKYFEEIYRILGKVSDSQMENIAKAARMLVDTSVQGKTVYAFGCNHAGLLAQELFYRSGGLVIVNPIMPPGLTLDVKPVTLTTSMERLEGYGNLIAANLPLAEGDLIIIHSVSGRNSVTVDLAIAARNAGTKVLALTNMEYSSAVPSRHSSGKRLFEVADLVLDNCGCYGDAAVGLESMPIRVAPTSTVIGAAILNAMVAEAAQLFIERGITPPVYASSNTEGGDQHNERVMETYKSSIKYL